MRFADIVVIKKVHNVGAEVVGIEYPSMKRNGYAELMLFVPLAMQRNEAKVVGIGKFNQRAGRSDQRRSLIVMAVEGAEGPIEMRHIHCGAEARADCALRDSAGEVRRPHART